MYAYLVSSIHSFNYGSFFHMTLFEFKGNLIQRKTVRNQ